jgi:hypothetical protein
LLRFWYAVNFVSTTAESLFIRVTDTVELPLLQAASAKPMINVAAVMRRKGADLREPTTSPLTFLCDGPNIGGALDLATIGRFHKLPAQPHSVASTDREAER